MNIVIIISALIQLLGPVVLEWVRSCLDEENGLTTLRNMGPIQRWVFFRAVRRGYMREGFSASHASAAAEYLMAEIDEAITEASNEELCEALGQFRNEVNATNFDVGN